MKQNESDDDKVLSAEPAARNPILPARIEERASFALAGISAVTTNEAEWSGAGKIGRLFEQFYSADISGQLAPFVQQPGLYSCYFNYERGVAGLFEVMVSVHVRDGLRELPAASVKTFVVPAAKYAVFVTEKGPIVEGVQRAWAAIWQWAQQSGCERTFTGDFEYYGTNPDPNDGQVEIYIAIR
ncbi:MAG: GyrI-like domain-containing protein [Paenibacillaceae bacterium]|nr:GyrI-like domain-containing protein [Paenibacillaceae bacterium]